MFEEIVNPSQLLTLKQFNELPVKQQEKYTVVANKFVTEWNEKYPNGKEVVATIKSINLSDRVNIVVNPVPELNTEVFSFPYLVTDRIASNAGLGDTDGLKSLVLTTLEPLKLTMKLRAVVAGDTYTKSDKTTATYKCAAVVKVDGTREELLLSKDAQAIVAEIHGDLLKDSVRAASQARRAGRRGTETSSARVAVVHMEDEADV